MQALSLNPLPFHYSEESHSHRNLRMEGFVDEEVVTGLIERGVYERAFAQPEGMVLSSSEDDYAGWALPEPSPFRGMEETHAPAPAPVRRLTPPDLTYSEEGIESTYAGGHRWRLFGVSGAMIFTLLALILLSLAHRVKVQEIATGNVPVPIEAEVPKAITAEPAPQPTLNKTQSDSR